MHRKAINILCASQKELNWRTVSTRGASLMLGVLCKRIDGKLSSNAERRECKSCAAFYGHVLDR